MWTSKEFLGGLLCNALGSFQVVMEVNNLMLPPLPQMREFLRPTLLAFIRLLLVSEDLFKMMHLCRLFMQAVHI